MTGEQLPGTPNQPETVHGEIVDDASSASFGGTGSSPGPVGAAAAAGTNRLRKSAEPPEFNRQTRPEGGQRFTSPPGGEWPAAPFSLASGGTAIGGAFGVFRMLRSSPEVRSLLAAPLRMLTVAVLVPAVLAGLLGLAIDGRAGAVVAFTIAGCGVIAAILLEVNRRRLIAGQLGAPPTAGRTAVRPATGSGLRGLVGLIVGALLVMMLAIGFDLLTVLLLLFGAW